MKTRQPQFKKQLTDFQEFMVEYLRAYWELAREFHSAIDNDYRSAKASRMIAKEKSILRQLGLPQRSFTYSYPIQRLGLEPYCYEELLHDCLFTLIHMAETYLMSPAKSNKTLLQEALTEKTPGMELFAELNMPTTSYALYLYYEHFLSGQLSVDVFLHYLLYLKEFRPPNGQVIPYDLETLSPEWWRHEDNNCNLLYIDKYKEYLHYIYAKDPWVEKKQKPEKGILCPEEVGLIFDRLFLLRVDSKLSDDYVRIDAIVPMNGKFHKVEIGCSMALFQEMLAGCRYTQAGSHLSGIINRHIEQHDFAISLDMKDIYERSLEINRCYVELSVDNKAGKKGKKLTCFTVEQIDPRQSTFMMDK